MKILSAQQIREGDRFTIENEPVSGIQLMERAATSCVDWISKQYLFAQKEFYIFCGTGNNGGDGLAIARLLHQKEYRVYIFLVKFSDHFSADCQTNFERLQQVQQPVNIINSEDQFPNIPENAVIIDALFGTGLSRPLTRLAASLVTFINNNHLPVIAVDMPSGLFADNSSKNDVVIHATDTLSFEWYKLAFLMQENEEFTGRLHILPIGILPGYQEKITTQFYLIDEEIIQGIYQPRKIFSHKGNYGHALLIAGNYGKMGAAVLASRACLRAGAGLLTTSVPQAGYEIIQVSIPEAMCIVRDKQSTPANIFGESKKYQAVGIGPGIGTDASSLKLLEQTFQWNNKPTIIDADGLNILSAHPELLDAVPPQSIFTPHPKEFERLFGPSDNDFARLNLLREKAQKHHSYIILKGHYSCVACPDGSCYFNNTGNPGMATGGSGDVLTGILTGILAQGYSPKETAILGVYLHGLAGDIAAAHYSQEAMLAGDIINFLGMAYHQISKV